MTSFLRYGLLTMNWLIIAFGELLLLTAGLVSQGHDKGRLIPIALAVIILPVMGYGIHRFILWLLPAKAPTQPQ